MLACGTSLRPPPMDQSWSVLKFSFLFPQQQKRCPCMSPRLLADPMDAAVAVTMAVACRRLPSPLASFLALFLALS